jgi:hypothetical protein
VLGHIRRLNRPAKSWGLFPFVLYNSKNKKYPFSAVLCPTPPPHEQKIFLSILSKTLGLVLKILGF